jgi:hypothetical protein
MIKKKGSSQNVEREREREILLLLELFIFDPTVKSPKTPFSIVYCDLIAFIFSC